MNMNINMNINFNNYINKLSYALWMWFCWNGLDHFAMEAHFCFGLGPEIT